MTTLVHADIFFFVTTIAVALVTILFAIAIVYIVKILKDLHYVSQIVRREADLLAEDLQEIREKVKQEGLFTTFFGMISRLFSRREKRSNDKKTKEKK